MERYPYLERIGYSGELAASLAVLSKLQQNHLLTVPFENLDIIYKTKISLPGSYDKIVNRYRGGFCYELNYSFYQLLKHTGFDVKLVSARVYEKTKGFGAEFDHMAIIADIDNTDYLVDVGFGEFAFHPLKINLNTDLDDPRGLFRIEPYDESYLAVRKKDPDGGFTTEYIFSLKERAVEEFYTMCRYHQTSPESHFTQKRLCTLATNDGRITLTGNTFKVTVNKMVTEVELGSEPEVQQVLLDYFNVNLINGRH
jgi:N-hydroxyarylamine O-acetyltransferase